MTRFPRGPILFASLAGALALLICLAWPPGAVGAGVSRPPLARQVVPTAPPEATAVTPGVATVQAEPTPPPDVTADVTATPDLSTPTPTPEPPMTPEAYRARVIGEINLLRSQVGLQPLATAPPEANEGMADYLAVITPTMLSSVVCVNGATLGVGSAWDYAAARGYAAEPLGELLTCAGTAYWAPLDNVSGWRASPDLRTLLGDTTADTIACGGYAAQPDGRGYRSYVCVTYRAS